VIAAADVERQFSLLKRLLELSRSQEQALHDADFTRFEDLMDERIEVMQRIAELQSESEQAPDNVIPLQTAFRVAHEADTSAATDIVIRLILDQDAVNEALLADALSTGAVPA